MDNREHLKTIMSREYMHTYPQCPACGRPFAMGEPVVKACGDWGNALKLVHEEDAEYDEQRCAYVVKENLP
jgi:hypothetical protein